jgi:hypothetical protein
MTDINTSNAIAQERARIREEVVNLSEDMGVIVDNDRLCIPFLEVLRIIRNDQNNNGKN